MNIVRDSPPEGIIRNGVDVPVHCIDAEKRKERKGKEKRREKKKKFIKIF